jgi:hypothetical protein
MSFDLKIKNADLVIENGDIKSIIDSEKLIQDVLKICLTPVGFDALNPWYGSFLSKTVIGSPESDSLLNTVSKNQIIKALENLKDLQGYQIKSQQKLSADEQIASVQSVQVLRSEIDPRVFEVYITVITKGFKPITTAFRLSTI